MQNWQRFWTIYKRECNSYLVSPVSYIFVILLLLLCGFFTFASQLGDFFAQGEASLTTFFRWHPWLFIIFVPVIGMGMWSDEKRQGTLELLMTMPLSPWNAILGKFFAAWSVIFITLFLTFPMVITVEILGNPDEGVILTGYLGSFLLAGAYLSISTMFSAMTKNSMACFIISTTICLLLILIGHPPVIAMLINWDLPNWLINFVEQFSIVPHFESLQKGIIDLRDIIYYCSIMTFTLFVTSILIRGRRAI